MKLHLIFKVPLCLLIVFSLSSFSSYAQSVDFLQVLSGGGSLEVGDANNDGQNEILFGFGWKGGRKPEAILLGLDVLWAADIPFEEAGEVTVDIGDINDDAENEIIIMNASPSSNGAIRIYKHAGNNDFQLLWSETLNEGFRRIDIGNTDSDPEKEFVIGNSFYDRTLYVYDYQGSNTWSGSPIEYVGEDCHAIRIADADNDGQNEIVAGLGVWPPYSVRIYKYISGNYQMIWQYSFWSGNPYGPGYWVDVGDIDNDSQNEILVCENSSLVEGNSDDIFIFEHSGGTNWTLSWSGSTGVLPENWGAYSPVIGKILNNGNNQFAIVSMDTLIVYEHQNGTYQQVLTKPLDTKIAQGRIFGGDVDNDGNYEIIHTTGGQLSIYRGSAASVGIQDYPSNKAYSMNLAYPNPFNSSVNIKFNSTSYSKGKLQIYDIRGSLIRTIDISVDKGDNIVTWDSKNNLDKYVATGTYFYKITFGRNILEGKLLLIK